MNDAGKYYCRIEKQDDKTSSTLKIVGECKRFQRICKCDLKQERVAEKRSLCLNVKVT